MMKSTLILTGIMVAAALFLLIGNHMRSQQVQASDPHTTVTWYKSVYVNPGDSLWIIADEYMDDGYEDKNAYIDEIREINHISGSQLQSGTYIIIPYTVSEAE